VKKNIEDNCRKELVKIDEIKKRSTNRQKLAYEKMRDDRF